MWIVIGKAGKPFVLMSHPPRPNCWETLEKAKENATKFHRILLQTANSFWYFNVETGEKVDGIKS